MDIHTATEQVAETGRLLLEKKLVARTWGNFSARLDESHFCITPSGLGYEHMTSEDIVRYNLTDDTYEGSHKPSSEKGIHAAAYRLFPDVGFVVHTHQIYATALGLTAPECLQITGEEARRLGGIAWADYGLPGTKKLCSAVTSAMEQGAHSVLMVHHGALICGRDREDAMERAALLEDICRRNCRWQEVSPSPKRFDALLERVRKIYPTAAIEDTAPVQARAALKTHMRAQIDDMAQMIGRKIPVANGEEDALRLLEKRNVVLLPGVGAIVHGEDAEDTAALLVLIHKAAVASLHCRMAGKRAHLGPLDCIAMRRFYLLKYSKQKKG